MPASDQLTGPELEARALRLYLAQGTFAERGLQPTATPDRRMLATDIDVLVSEYTSGFHLTRRHLECKTGRISLLDRILWLRGVRSLLQADSTYLLANDIDFGATDFARGLDVELFSVQHLEAWEKSLGITPDMWPCRSDYLTFDAAKVYWSKVSGDHGADESWRTLREAIAFVEVESWLAFRYRHLNKLLRLLGDIAAQWRVISTDRDRELCARYVFSALLVRLSQYVLAMCADLANILPTELDKRLTSHLVFGDHDSTHATALIRKTATWISAALVTKGTTLPEEIDIARLSAPPPYSQDLVGLVRKVLENSHESRYLPLAMERLQFGTESDDKIPRLRAAAQFADTLAAHVRAFVVRAFTVPEELAKPPHAELTNTYRVLSNTASITVVGPLDQGSSPNPFVPSRRPFGPGRRRGGR